MENVGLWINAKVSDKNQHGKISCHIVVFLKFHNRVKITAVRGLLFVCEAKLSLHIQIAYWASGSWSQLNNHYRNLEFVDRTGSKKIKSPV